MSDATNEDYGQQLEGLWVQCLAVFLSYLARAKGATDIRKAVLLETYREDFMLRMTQRPSVPQFEAVKDMEVARMFAIATMANGELN